MVVDAAHGHAVRRYLDLILRVIAVAAAYYASAEVGLLLALVRNQVTPLWPPTGVALIGLLLLGRRTWPGIAIGAFAVNMTIGPSVPAVLAITAGNTLAPLVAVQMLRAAGFRNSLDRLRDGFALVFLGGLVGMLISSTIGAATLVISGAVPAGSFVPTWSVWWTGDAMGVLVVAPLLLLVVNFARIRGPVRAGRVVEAALLAAGTAGAALVATTSPYDLLTLVFPFLIWAALRFEQLGAAPCALLVSVIAIRAAAHGSGPFAGHDLLGKMVTLQVFNGTAALVAFLLAALTTERKLRARQLRDRARVQESALSDSDAGSDSAS
jgi:integral membrane sensor domain MASE1